MLIINFHFLPLQRFDYFAAHLHHLVIVKAPLNYLPTLLI